MSIAIIGAGPAGLVSAKSALECDLKPTIFEKGNAVGGLWKPHEGFVWDSMKTNISHHCCMFSDFPWDKSTVDFPDQSEVHRYLQDYAEHFKLTSHLRLNTLVQSVAKQNAKWVVTWLQNDRLESGSFDYVLVCSGIFSKAYIPEIDSGKFRGTLLHAKDYKTPEAFRGKQVVVVGNAFSGAEIASEVSLVASRVTNVYHRNLWLMPRYLPSHQDPSQKLPLDLLFYSRGSNARSQSIAQDVAQTRKEAWFKSITKQEERCPELAVESGPSMVPFVAVSDTYVDRVQEGKVILKRGSIRQMDEEGFLFEDGDRLDADAAIFCTGFQTDLPFLDRETKDMIGYEPQDQLQPLLLHKTVFHPRLPGMAFVGMYRGPYFATIELQARWACMVFSKRVPAPSQDDMQRGIDEELKIRKTYPRMQFPHGDYVNFCDDLAKQIAALPDWVQLQAEDPVLYNKLWEGPLTAASYRLAGFGSKPELAMSLIDRVNQAVHKE